MVMTEFGEMVLRALFEEAKANAWGPVEIGPLFDRLALTIEDQPPAPPPAPPPCPPSKAPSAVLPFGMLVWLRV